MANPPILIFDGDCSFCKYWVNRWKRKTAGKVNYVPYQEVPDNFEGISKAQFQRSVWLITADGRRLKAAAAVFELLRIGGTGTWNQIYHRVPLAGKVFELGYRLIANNRNLFYKLTKLFFRDV
ncbi:DUF393 domain-containing protein [Pontibacter sp. 172403-2]|uniref:thiol-disulfide oxidoreductase DCC family protein n=1 Tax=Pontibacter rufus TaxID=2791028 RepID=UPI0018AFA0F7|nr:DCC1-like thiol-disulfide oxidoreductase family protein [Pontibacter sp. 172403-2]MBF9251818.1 DUF393 domain-containing protein [Pontibacter sp. 172403-2]